MAAFKSYYNLKRYQNYIFTLRRISQDYKKEYVEHISREFQESRAAGELDLELFTRTDKKKLLLLMEDPKKYYEEYGVYETNKEGLSLRETAAERRCREIENSTTYKVGKMVMFLPIKIKKMLKKR